VSTTPDEPSPETCSSSPGYAPGQNYATSPSASEYYPDRLSQFVLVTGIQPRVMSVLPLPVLSGSAQLCLAGTLKLQLWPRRPGKPEVNVIRSQASL
jgi:hypothetical protein